MMRRDLHRKLALFGLCCACALVLSAVFLGRTPSTAQRDGAPSGAEKSAEPVADATIEPSAPSAPEPSDGAAALGQALKEELASRISAVHQELALIDRLRKLQFADPELAIRLIEDFDERFPGNTPAPERAWYQARNLVYLSRFDEARQLALQVNEQYPDDSWSRDLSRHLLSHPFGLPPRGPMSPLAR